MNELIQKVEARIADRRDVLEGIRQSHMASDILKSEIAFLAALLAEMKAMVE
jgi:hypothetical protein